MKSKRLPLFLTLVATLLGLISVVSIALAAENKPMPTATTTLIDEVRRSTARYQNVKAAEAAGYALFHGCVNGPDHGAMGVHFVHIGY